MKRPVLSASVPDRVASHVEQAVIRLLLALGGAVAILVELGMPLAHALEQCECLSLVLAYIPWAALLLLWSIALKGVGPASPSLHLRLGVALVTDVVVVACFTATSGHYAPLSLPVFLWIIVGYGWRFGTVYALAAGGLCMLAFASAAPLNPLFAFGSVAAVGYYLCFLATPLYVLQVLGTPVPAYGPAWAAAAAMGAPAFTVHPMDSVTSTPAAPTLLDDTLLRELRHMFPDAAAWQHLVQQFGTEARALLIEAGTAMARGDDERIAVALHRLRGAAAAMAASRLEYLVAGLESDPSQPARWTEARETLDATVEVLDAAT